MSLVYVKFNHYPSSSPFYPFVDLIVVLWMVKKHFLPTPDMASQARGDCRRAFLPPFALSDRQAHVWSDEIKEQLKDEQPRHHIDPRPNPHFLLLSPHIAPQFVHLQIHGSEAMLSFTLTMSD